VRECPLSAASCKRSYPQDRVYPLGVGFHEINVRVVDEGDVAGVGCCFCDEAISPTRIDPVTIDLTANDVAVSQLLWAHARCLRAARLSDLRDEFYE
jgi:hypothetical protein